MSGLSSKDNNNKDGTGCRIVVLGAPGVGKTALTVRFLTKRFIGEYCPTLESTHTHQLQVEEEDVTMEILDTAGQTNENWKEFYGLWGDCFLFIYSVTDRQSFEMIANIKNKVETARKSTSLVAFLVGNKKDLQHERAVPTGEGEELADEIGCQFHEVSASDGNSVLEVVTIFHDLCKEFKKQKGAREGRQRKISSSQRLKHAITKVIRGRSGST